MTHALTLVLAYIFGSLPIGLYVGKLVKNIDVRDFGSGNTGASNVARVLGLPWATLVFLLDVAKGLLPTVVAHFHAGTSVSWWPVLTGLAAILGHNFSLFLKFKGGKGVATSLGVAFGLSWQAGVIGFGTWSLLLLATRYISVASIIATAVGSFCIWWFNHRQLPPGCFAGLATLFVVVKHKANLQRLKNGTEPKVTLGRKK